jgi:hypothetical protein
MTVHCVFCQHRAPVSVPALAERLGARYRVQAFIERSVCSQCGARWPKIGVTATPAASVGTGRIERWTSQLWGYAPAPATTAPNSGCNSTSRFGEAPNLEPSYWVCCCLVMRYTIKQIKPAGELWLVRKAGQGVWGSHERACIFITRSAAEACLNRLKAADDGAIEIAPVQDAARDIVVLPDAISSLTEGS